MSPDHECETETNERAPLFINPPSIKLHLLLLFVYSALPIYLLANVMVHLYIFGIVAALGMWFIIALSVLFMIFWAIKIGKYLGYQSQRNRIFLTIILMGFLFVTYLIELFIIANIAINWAMKSN